MWFIKLKNLGGQLMNKKVIFKVLSGFLATVQLSSCSANVSADSESEKNIEKIKVNIISISKTQHYYR